jgi:hypothetical protein
MLLLLLLLGLLLGGASASRLLAWQQEAQRYADRLMSCQEHPASADYLLLSNCLCCTTCCSSLLGKLSQLQWRCCAAHSCCTLAW